MNKILIVLFIPEGVTEGGHIISAFQMANSFVEDGNDVYILMNNRVKLINKLNKKITSIFDNRKINKLTGYWKRGEQIYKIIKSKKINLVIAFDKLSTYHSSLPCSLLNIMFIPVIPGGSPHLYKCAPLKHTKIVLFSQETKSYLIKKWNFNENSLIVNSSRFNFAKEVDIKTDSSFSKKKEIKIAYITGLRSEKLTSYKTFLEQVKEINYSFETKIDIIGSGIDSELFSNITGFYKLKNIQLLGFKEVTYELINNYDLVVTMGRGVLESLSMKVPVAVCGEEGYKGLVNIENFHNFGKTNFTGRNMKTNGSIINDINYIQNLDRSVLDNLSKIVRKEYDVKNLTNAIYSILDKNLVPGNGSFFRALYLNFNSIISKNG